MSFILPFFIAIVCGILLAREAWRIVQPQHRVPAVVVAVFVCVAGFLSGMALGGW